MLYIEFGSCIRALLRVYWSASGRGSKYMGQFMRGQDVACQPKADTCV